MLIVTNLIYLVSFTVYLTESKKDNQTNRISLNPYLLTLEWVRVYKSMSVSTYHSISLQAICEMKWSIYTSHLHALKEQVRLVKIHQSHHNLDLPVEFKVPSPKILAKGCICQF